MNTTNAIAEICELVIRVEPSSAEDGELDCVVELRLASGDVELGEEACEISISKLTLSLDLEGLSAVPGSRYGEPRKHPVAEMERTTTQRNDASRSFKASADAKLDITGPSLGASSSGEVQASVQRETILTSQDNFVHQRVKARPNFRWEVREHDDSPLDGTYLESDSLVRLTQPERANRSTLVARATVKQKDVSISQVMRDGLSLRVRTH